MAYGGAFSVVKEFFFAGFSLVFLPNFLFYFLFDFLGVNRAYVNIDYSICMVIFVLGYRIFGILLLSIFSVLEVLSLVSQVMPFMRVADLVYLLGFVNYAPLEYRVLLWVSPLLIGGFVYFVFWSSKALSKGAALLVLNCLIGVYLFDLFVVSEGERKDHFWRAKSGSWVSSQAVFFHKSRSSSFIGNFEGDEVPVIAFQGAAASDKWRKDFSDGVLSPRLLMVVAESWGVTKNARIQEEILQPIYDLGLSHVSTGSIAFQGVTVGGELRELCRLSPKHFNLTNGYLDSSSCFPQMLAARGYKREALHGAAGLMYDRKSWYPHVGFDSSTFLETLFPPRFCYSFPGACDVDLFQKASDFFSKSGNRFFYWLTLNSHSMYDRRDIIFDTFDCEKYGLDFDLESCRNLKLQAQFFSGLADLLRRPEMSGVEVMIVGDHEPRIFSDSDFSAVFQDNVVPWINFRVGIN